MAKDHNSVFPFPFNPYPIQTQFMQELYGGLGDSKICIFESPTGTVSIQSHKLPISHTGQGKSLSIICGAMKWLRDHETDEIQQGDGKPNQEQASPPHTKDAKNTQCEDGSYSSDIEDLSSLEASMPPWLRDSHLKLERSKEKERQDKRKEVLSNQRARLKRLRDEEIENGRPKKKARCMVWKLFSSETNIPARTWMHKQ